MDGTRDIAVIVGSLRKGSYNRMAANALRELAPATLALEIVEIRALEMYDQDLDPDPPRSWIDFRERVARAAAVLFVTPEYNRSMPGALKNAIDVGSRPSGRSVWDGKPGAVISASPGVLGGFGANHHLRQALVGVNVPTMARPEVYIGGVAKLFDAEGKLTDDKTREHLQKFIVAFERWVNIHTRA